jgi:hypothetical protein
VAEAGQEMAELVAAGRSDAEGLTTIDESPVQVRLSASDGIWRETPPSVCAARSFVDPEGAGVRVSRSAICTTRTMWPLVPSRAP